MKMIQTYIFCSDSNLQNLESILNEPLLLVSKWLCADKFSINTPDKNACQSANVLQFL